MVALRERKERLLRLRHQRAREVVLVDRVVLGRHGPVQQWHDVAKNARRVGIAENDGGTVHPKEVELHGLDSLFFLADDLRVLHSGLGVRTCCCHYPAHTSASSLGGAAKGLRVEGVQKSLDADETVLEYVLGSSESFCLYITRTDVGVLSLSARRDQIERLTRQFVDQIESKSPATGKARQLYDLLVAPLPTRALKQRLIIVPDGELHILPWDSLVDKEGRYMVVSHVVTTAPSAMVLYLIRTTRPQKRSPLTLLAVGDVQYQRGVLSVRQLKGEQTGGLDADGLYDLAGHPLRNLPHTRDEVIEAGETLGGKAVELLGPDATETAFKREPLGQFRIIHIAAHGIASAQFPDRAALVLGEDSTKRDDGLLQAREIRNLHLNADLVTLSACDTGTGRLQGEEGIASLERAFFYAGARSVLASLWTTSDVYTTTLMRHFYHHLAEGQDEGRALQQAKLELIEQFRDQAAPLFWAGFTLAGEASRPITSVQH